MKANEAGRYSEKGQGRTRGILRPHLPMRGANRLYGANHFSISTRMLVSSRTVTEYDFGNAISSSYVQFTTTPTLCLLKGATLPLLGIVSEVACIRPPASRGIL